MASTTLRVLNAIDKVINLVETPVLIVTGLLLLSSLFYAAIVRYTRLASFPEETELSWLLYTWMVFIGSSSVLRRGDHPHVSFMRDKLGWKYVMIIHIVSMIYLGGLIYILTSYRWLYAVQRTAVMRLSLAYFYDAATIGFSLMIIRYLIKIVNMIYSKMRGGAK